MNKQHLIKYNSNKAKIEQAIKDLYLPATDIAIKYVAIEYLSHYMEEPDLRRKLEYLYEQETSYIIKRQFKKLLDGKYKSFIDEIEEHEINENVESPQEKLSKKLNSKENLNQISNEIKFKRFNSQIQPFQYKFSE